MKNDFFLLPYLGIFRKDSIESVAPSLNDDYGITITPPHRSSDEFSFQVVKTTTINLDITRKTETLVDPSFERVVCSTKTYNLDALLAAMFVETEDKDKRKAKIETSASNYARRLEKFEEYDAKMQAIEPLQGTEHYSAQLLLIKDPNLDETLKDKQATSLANLESGIMSVLDDITDQMYNNEEEDTNEEEDAESTVKPAIISDLDSEENISIVNDQVRKTLSKFYTEVLGESTYSDYFEDVEDDVTVDIDPEGDFEAAQDILNSEDTIRNTVNDFPGFDPSPQESSSPVENSDLDHR